MFKKTNPQQDLFGVASQLTASARERLESSWAEGFRKDVLPLLLASESDFEGLYGKTGRPSFSVGRILGICMLQEMNKLVDQAALDSFSFDTRWQHALDVTSETAYLSRRSFVEFRRRLVEHDPDMVLIRRVFDRISNTAINNLGLSTEEQRLDSTLVSSNIRMAGLLDLFRKTTRHFIRSLTSLQFAALPAEVAAWYNQCRDGWFGLGPSERREKLSELLPHVRTLIEQFADDKHVSVTEPYQLLVRVFSEHCEISTDGEHSSDSGGGVALKGKGKGKGKRKSNVEDAAGENGEIVLEHKKGSILQSPHDPDAEHGHKGSGYSAHITETCNNKGSTEIITDYEVLGNAPSDVGKADGVVSRLQDAGHQPSILFADAGYPTPKTLVELEEEGTTLAAPVNRGSLKDDVMGRDSFQFDDAGNVTQCPTGHQPIDHRIQNPNGDKLQNHAYFDGDRCRACPMLERCPVRAPNHRAKGTPIRETRGNFRLGLHPHLRARDARLAEQRTKQWKDRYKIRSGVEATMSELKRGHGMGKLRVRRLPRVHFAIACKVTACNIKRWLRDSQNPLVLVFLARTALLCPPRPVSAAA